MKVFGYFLIFIFILSCTGENLVVTRTKQEQLNLDVERIQGYISENNIDDAIKYSFKSIEYNKKNVEAYNTLGLIFKKKREFKKS